MRNAKKELTEITNEYRIICAKVKSQGVSISLNPGYSEKDLNNFLEALDFNYDAGYGSQNLFGLILCEDGIWFEREEYDGSEWWEIHKCPTVEEVLSYED